MAKPKDPTGDDVSVVTLQDAAAAVGVSDQTTQMLLLEQLRNSLWVPEYFSKERASQHLTGAIERLKDIAPKGALESMLATQMIATHEAAMECLRRAMLQDQTFEARDQNLKHATKLLATYERQLTALNKHRGKGQQKVTVKHVHVHEGGQAIVGDLHGASAQAPVPETHRPAIAAPRETPIDMTSATNLAAEPTAVPVDAVENKKVAKRRKRRPAP